MCGWATRSEKYLAKTSKINSIIFFSSHSEWTETRWHFPNQPAELLLFARRTKLSESSANDLRGCGDILDEMEFSSSRKDQNLNSEPVRRSKTPKNERNYKIYSQLIAIWAARNDDECARNNFASINSVIKENCRQHIVRRLQKFLMKSSGGEGQRRWLTAGGDWIFFSRQILITKSCGEWWRSRKKFQAALSFSDPSFVKKDFKFLLRCSREKVFNETFLRCLHLGLHCREQQIQVFFCNKIKLLLMVEWTDA